MLKARLQSDQSGDLYILGLEAGNITKLKDGAPIILNLKELQGPDVRIMLCFGETHDDIKKTIEEAFDVEFPEVQ